MAFLQQNGFEQAWHTLVDHYKASGFEKDQYHTAKAALSKKYGSSVYQNHKHVHELLETYVSVDDHVRAYQIYRKQLELYADEATKYEHLDEIRKEYGYQTFTLSEYRSLCKHLFSHAMANGNPLHLIQLALEDLRKQKVILPSMATIERAVWETRKRTEEKIFKTLNSSLTDDQVKNWMTFWLRCRIAIKPTWHG